MSKEAEYKGHKYWVTIEPAIHPNTQESCFVAFVSDYKPTAYHWGTEAKDENGNKLFFQTEFIALTNANHIKQSEIDSKGN